MLKLFRFVLVFAVTFFSCSVLGKRKGKVLDLGEIEITGEVRRPNVNIVYSKKYFNKALRTMAKKELKQFEKELLTPASLKGFSKKRK